MLVRSAKNGLIQINLVFSPICKLNYQYTFKCQSQENVTSYFLARNYFNATSILLCRHKNDLAHINVSPGRSLAKRGMM